MDRNYEDIRAEVLELDYVSQRKLADDIEENIAASETEYDKAWKQEIARRMDAHRRGEATYVTWEHMMDMAEKKIAKAERKSA